MADRTGGSRNQAQVAELEELLAHLPVREFGSLSLTTKRQLTLPGSACEIAGIDSLAYLWGLPELRMLMLVGQPKDPGKHLKFLANAD